MPQSQGQPEIKLTPKLPNWVRKDQFQPYYTNIHALLQDSPLTAKKIEDRRRLYGAETIIHALMQDSPLTAKQKRENRRRLYGTETIQGFNDWDASVLLLAKDAGPVQTFERLIKEGDPKPWRAADERDRKGRPTNTRLRNLASVLPGTKLYGSVMAGLLRNDGRQRGPLPNFYDPELQGYLQ